MPKTSYVNARIDSDLKEKAETILHEIGLTKTEAMKLFYYQICLNNGLPFPVRKPNSKTAKVLRDSEKGIGLIRTKNKSALFKKLKT